MTVRQKKIMIAAVKDYCMYELHRWNLKQKGGTRV